MKTHYDVLGVPFGADYETIKAAYRKALKVYHPDLHEGNANAERLSKQIIDAHAVLKDPDQRALYDEYILHRGQQRRRLFLITLMLTVGLACGGTLFFLNLSLQFGGDDGPAVRLDLCPQERQPCSGGRIGVRREDENPFGYSCATFE